jgi:alkyl hydroperoxide reductase subunit AhpC
MIWGLLLVPTFLAWTAFVTAAYAVTGSRYASYALALGALILTGYKALTNGMNWAGNWTLWGAIRWSDLGFFEADRAALVVNRVMVLGLAVFFTVLAVRLFGRRGTDAVRTMHRLSPRSFFRAAARMLPYAAVPVVSCVALLLMVNRGIEGGAARKADKDYWAKNLKTWFEAPLPDIARLDVKVKVDPARHWLSSEGSLTLVNPLDSTLASIPLTGGLHWKNLAWTMNGETYQPEFSQHLYVFTPPRPLATGDSVVVGWKFDGRYPDGVTKNGGNTSEFILPSGMVLTGFSPAFLPVLGFQEDRGETDKNRTEPKQYPRDYYRGITRGGYGATAWYPARIAITGPEEYTLNGPGVCTSNTVEDGWRTQVWETDHPVKIVNIVCGRWKEKRGAASTIYYHAGHEYNVEEMSATLDAARRWYSEWFMPYPWRELKLSEFPGLAGYAQGFGTNITFSENIGFLTRNTAQTDATFLVTAHEAAHQWWGNILTPANGPNGDFLSEGTAHFSTMLLFEQVKGPRAHGVREGHRGALQRPPPARRRASDVRRGREAALRHQRHLRPRRLGVLDDLRLHGPRARDGRLPRFLPDLEPRARPPGAAGLRRGHAPPRARPGGLRRIRPPVVRGEGDPAVPGRGCEEVVRRRGLGGHGDGDQHRHRRHAGGGGGHRRRALEGARGWRSRRPLGAGSRLPRRAHDRHAGRGREPGRHHPLRVRAGARGRGSGRARAAVETEAGGGYTLAAPGAARTAAVHGHIRRRHTLMALQIGDIAPDFKADTTEGPIQFHQWLGDSWCVLFSHPKDFTPVCTTELGYMAKVKHEFDRRNVKILGISVDSVADHQRWKKDIEETQGASVAYPMIGDTEMTVAKLYGMIHPNATGSAATRTAADNQTVRTVFVIGPDKKIKLMISYPMSTGRNFDEVLRVIDSLQLTSRHSVATPANWKKGDDVIILASVSDEDAKQKFPQGWKAPKPYLRIVKQPEDRG